MASAAFLIEDGIVGDDVMGRGLGFQFFPAQGLRIQDHHAVASPGIAVEETSVGKDPEVVRGGVLQNGLAAGAAQKIIRRTAVDCRLSVRCVTVIYIAVR